jgi:hypothetical protein
MDVLRPLHAVSRSITAILPLFRKKKLRRIQTAEKERSMSNVPNEIPLDIFVCIVGKCLIEKQIKTLLQNDKQKSINKNIVRNKV